MAAAPVGRVEIEFSTGTWTDVTIYWDAKRAVTITGGRTDTDEHVPPGRLSGLWLDNTDGRFTVGNASGAYWPNVATGRRVRFSIKDPASGTYYPRFTGRIDGWPLSWADNGTTCWVCLSATDLLNDWAVADMPVDWMYRCVVAEGPLAYWECTPLDASGALVDRVRGLPLVNRGTGPTTLTVPGPPGDPRPLPQFTYGSSTADYRGVAPAVPSNGWAISAWMRITGDDLPPTGYYPIVVERVVAMPPGDRVAILVKPAGVYASTISSGGVVTDRAASGVDIADGSWHCVLLTVADAGGGNATVTITVDGANVTSAGLTASTLLCDATLPRTVSVGTTTAGVVGHVALWAAGTPPGLITLTKPAQGLYGVGATASAHLSRIASIAGLAAPTVVGAERVSMGPANPFGKALDLARVVEDTDGGVLWCDGSGTVTYTASPLRTSGAPLALSMTAADVSPDLAVAVDRAHIANDVTVTNVAPLDGWRPDPTVTTVHADDAASVAAMGRRPKTLSTSALLALPSAEGHLATRAAELMATREAPRIPTVPVDVMALTQAQQQAVLFGDADMWAQIAIIDLPSAGGLPTAWLGRIEGWTETVGVDQWRIEFATSFAGNRLEHATFGLILGSNRLG